MVIDVLSVIFYILSEKFLPLTKRPRDVFRVGHQVIQSVIQRVQNVLNKVIKCSSITLLLVYGFLLLYKFRGVEITENIAHDYIILKLFSVMVCTMLNLIIREQRASF